VFGYAVTINYVLAEEFWIDTELTLVSGFASIHFEKYSTTNTMLMPHICRGHDGAINCTGYARAFVLRENL
jgi:hypothetical protein